MLPPARVYLWVLRRPRLSAALLLIPTVVLALYIPRLGIDASADGLMIANDPARLSHEQFKRRFGSDSLTVILLKSGDVFTHDTLKVLRRITDRVERLDGVARVDSLTTVDNVRGRTGWLDISPLVGSRIPSDAGRLHRMRADAISNPTFVKNLISRDGRAAAVNIYTDPDPGDKGFNKRFSEQVDAILDEEASPGISLYQIGIPLVKAAFGDYILHDQLGFILLAITLLLAALFLVYRSWQMVLIPVATGTIGTFWALGLMAIFGYPVDVLTAVIPALGISLGFTEDIFLINEYHDALRRGQRKEEALRTMAAVMAFPILMTSLTTIAGFGSLAVSRIAMLDRFARAAALALASNFIVTILAVPLLLRVMPAPKDLRGASPRGPRKWRLERLLETVASSALRWRFGVSTAALLLAALSVWGMCRLQVNNDFISHFKESSFVRRRTADMHRSLAGTLTFSIVVDTGQADGVRRPEVLRSTSRLEDFLRRESGVDKTVSIVDSLKLMHREINGGNPAFERVPDSAELAAQYLLLLEGSDLSRHIDHLHKGAHVIIRHNITSSREFSALLRRIRGFAAREFPEGTTLSFTGEEVLVNNAADHMAASMAGGFSLAFLACLIIHTYLFRSLTAGILTLIPNILPALATMGLMGFSGIPLNTATALIAAISIGIVVDDTIHLMIRYGRERAGGLDSRQAISRAFSGEGKAVFATSLGVAGGFMILTASNFIPTIQFGALSAFAIVIGLICELTLTPVIMYYMGNLMRGMRSVEWPA